MLQWPSKIAPASGHWATAHRFPTWLAVDVVRRRLSTHCDKGDNYAEHCRGTKRPGAATFVYRPQGLLAGLGRREAVAEIYGLKFSRLCGLVAMANDLPP